MFSDIFLTCDFLEDFLRVLANTPLKPFIFFRLYKLKGIELFYIGPTDANIFFI